MPQYPNDDLLAKIREDVQQAEMAMLPYSSDWLANKLYIGGNQWLETDTGAPGGLRRTPGGDETFKPVTFNIYQTVVRTLVAKLTAQQPIPVVTPATSSSEDRATARASEHLIRYFWRAKRLQQEYLLLVTDMLACGGGWWHMDWDADAGELVPEEDEDAADLSDEAVGRKPKMVRTGDICARFISNFEMRVDPSARRWVDARWVARVYPLPADTIKDKYDFDAMPDWSNRTNIISPFSWLNYQSTIIAKDLCEVTEYWIKPCHKYKKGKHVVVVNGEALVNEDLSPEGLPFEYVDLVSDPDNFYGSTPMSDARQPQRQLNINMTLIPEGRNRTIFGVWLAAHDAQMEAPTGEAGEVITYNGNASKPSFEQPQPISPQIFNFNAMITDALSLITGVSASALGDQDAATSGRDRLFAAEEDNTKLGPILQNLHGFLKLVGMKMLNLWRTNARYPLKYAVGDPNAMGDVQQFDAAKITFSDVEMSIASSLPLNASARRDVLLAWIQAGIIPPERGLKLLEIAGVDEAIGSKNLDVERARNENQLMEVQEIDVREWEDHAAHIEEHLGEIKQARCYADPNWQARLEQHMAMHKFFLQQALGIPQNVPAGGQSAGGLTDSPTGADNSAGPASEAVIPQQVPVSARDNAALGQINGRAIGGAG